MRRVRILSKSYDSVMGDAEQTEIKFEKDKSTLEIRTQGTLPTSVDLTTVKRRSPIPRKEGALLTNIYCTSCSGDTTWIVTRVYVGGPGDLNAWRITCLGCQFR